MKSCSIVRVPRFEERIRTYHVRHHQTGGYPLIVNMAGSGRWGPGASLRWASEDACSVELVTMGNVALSGESGDAVVAPGGVYLVHAGSQLRYSTGPAGVLHKRFMVLGGSALEPLLRSTGLRNEVVLKPTVPGEVESAMRTAARLLDTRTGDWECELSTLAYRLLAVLARDIGTPYPAVVRRALDYMERNLSRAVALANVCRYAGASEAHFSRVFRRHVGMPPMQYFQRQRMDWAQRLLTASMLSIKEVSAKVGFEDPLYFSSQFRSVVGQSPSEFRAGSAGRSAKGQRSG